MTLSRPSVTLHLAQTLDARDRRAWGAGRNRHREGSGDCSPGAGRADDAILVGARTVVY